jgi:hypothetical protein
MKCIRFNFSHPFRGYASLIPLSDKLPHRLRFTVDSKDSTFVKIPLKACREGRWKLVLDWEYDGKIFSHQEEFESKKGRIHFNPSGFNAVFG